MIKKVGENNFRKKGKNQSRDWIERERSLNSRWGKNNKDNMRKREIVIEGQEKDEKEDELDLQRERNLHKKKLLDYYFF